MRTHDIIVIAASCGGIGAAIRIASDLPHDLPASIFLVIHIGAHSPGHIPRLLESAGPLRACHPMEGQTIERGWIYVALPDRHLLIDRGYVHLSCGPKENHTRPAADPLFRSAAECYTDRVVGVVLTGGDSDGTKGLIEIKKRGGLAIVQDPREAENPSMPVRALIGDDPDYSLPLDQIAPLLAELSVMPVGTRPA